MVCILYDMYHYKNKYKIFELINFTISLNNYTFNEFRPLNGQVARYRVLRVFTFFFNIHQLNFHVCIN